MNFPEFALHLFKNQRLNACLVTLILASTQVGPAWAHHEIATRMGLKLPAGLKPVPVNLGSGSKASDAANQLDSRSKDKPSVPAGKPEARGNVDRVLILGGAEAFPM